METIERKLARLYADSAMLASEYEPVHALAKCESEIEKLMLRALWARGSWSDRLWVEPFVNDSAMLVDMAIDKCRPVLGLQIPVSNYRVDFLLVDDMANGEPPLLLAIECDGHEFHSRTKQQAKRDRVRDRNLQAVGLHVMRFTGSEIWNNPAACADEAIEFARMRWSDSTTRAVQRVQATIAAKEGTPP